MRGYWTLARRELAGYFLSPMGYVVIAAALLTFGFSFLALLNQVQGEPMTAPVTELYFVTWYFWLIPLVTIPMITMRLFALEKFSGTFETLMTAPVSDLQVVLAKFSAGLIFYLVMWLPMLACLVLVRHYARETGAMDASVLASTLLGVLLPGSLLIALGCCASACTRSQVIAGIVSLLFGICLLLLGVLADRVQTLPGWKGQVLAAFFLSEQMRDFSRGVVDTRPLILYVTSTLFVLFLTLRIVESRRWK